MFRYLSTYYVAQAHCKLASDVKLYYFDLLEFRIGRYVLWVYVILVSEIYLRFSYYLQNRRQNIEIPFKE